MPGGDGHNIGGPSRVINSDGARALNPDEQPFICTLRDIAARSINEEWIGTIRLRFSDTHGDVTGGGSGARHRGGREGSGYTGGQVVSSGMKSDAGAGLRSDGDRIGDCTARNGFVIAGGRGDGEARNAKTDIDCLCLSSTSHCECQLRGTGGSSCGGGNRQCD